MTACTIGPKYCPKCGAELAHNESICNTCKHELREKKRKFRSRFPVKLEKEFSDQKSKKLRLIIGALYSGFALFCLYYLTMAFYYPDVPPFLDPLFYFRDFLYISLFVLYTAPIGIALLLFSLNPKYKGIFLTILGYVLLIMSFFGSYSFFSLSYYIVILLIFIDIPIIITILLGMVSINKDYRITHITGFFTFSFAFAMFVTIISIE